MLHRHFHSQFKVDDTNVICVMLFGQTFGSETVLCSEKNSNLFWQGLKLTVTQATKMKLKTYLLKFKTVTICLGFKISINMMI